MVKRLPTMQETWVLSLGREDPLEKEMATHSSIHAWKIPWTEESGELHTVHGVAESDTTSLHCCFFGDSLVVQLVKNLPAMQETQD